MAKYLDSAMNDVEPLRAAFDVEDKRPEREYFVVACKVCHSRWTVGIKKGHVHAGNILTMLDHAASHSDELTHGKAGR